MGRNVTCHKMFDLDFVVIYGWKLLCTFVGIHEDKWLQHALVKRECIDCGSRLAGTQGIKSTTGLSRDLWLGTILLSHQTVDNGQPFLRWGPRQASALSFSLLASWLFATQSSPLSYTKFRSRINVIGPTALIHQQQREGRHIFIIRRDDEQLMKAVKCQMTNPKAPWNCVLCKINIFYIKHVTNTFWACASWACL